VIHPEDVLNFEEVRQAMFRVAKRYGLVLRSVTPHPKPEYRDAPLGDCATWSGDIRLTMRGMERGTWDPEPRRLDDVWKTAAHELSHLRHPNHGVAFQEFQEELEEALENQTEDHREKVLRRLVKMQACRDSEAKLGNEHAAEAFAAAVNRMMIENELKPSDLDYQRAKLDDPVVQVFVELGKHGVERKKVRIAWQESLARVVANAHLCRFLVRQGSNDIWFVGTRSHATVAEYVYAILAREADKLADKEYLRYFYRKQAEGRVEAARGFRAAWLDAFVSRVEERLEAERDAAVKKAAADVPGGESVALMRIDGALAKVAAYMDDKFKRKARHAARLNGGRAGHVDGRAWGRAAADRMPIGRRGVETGAAPRGFLVAASKGKG
jgi:hypothetical protein